MRLIPKNTKVKTTVFWKFTFPDLAVLSVFIVLAFVCIMVNFPYHYFVLAGVLVPCIFFFIPTDSGFFYITIMQSIRFAFGKKKFSRIAKNSKEHVGTLIPIQSIAEDGLISYAKEKEDKRCYKFARVVSVRQKNFCVLDDDAQDAEIAALANWFRSIDENQMLDIVKIDVPVNLDKFSSALSERYLNVCKENFGKESVRNVKETILTKRIAQIDRMNNIDRQFNSEYYFVFYANSDEELQDTISYARSQLEDFSLVGDTLDRDATAVFLKRLFTNNFDDREILPTNNADLLAWILPHDVKFTTKAAVVDGEEQSTVCIKDFPPAVTNCWGAKLMNVPNTKAVFRIRPVPKQKAISRIDHAVSELGMRLSVSEKASEANQTLIHNESMVELLDLLDREGETLCDCTLFFTTYNRDKDPKFRIKTRKKIRSLGFKENNLWALQRETFRMAAAIPVPATAYDIGMPSSTAMAIYPYIHTTVMDEKGTLLGKNARNNYPFFFDFWKWEYDNKHFQNANAFVVGKSGSGKTFFLKSVVTNEWANGTRIVILDPEAEYLRLTDNLHGDIIDVGNSLQGSINPFQIYGILSEDGLDSPPDVTFNAHLKNLESFLKIVMEGIRPEALEVVNSLVVEMYKKHGINEMTDCSAFEPRDFPTFSDLYEVLNEEMSKDSDEHYKGLLRTAKIYLEKFVTGRYADVWNRPSSLETGSDIVTFNFQSLFAQKNTVVANAQMLLVFRFLEQEIINMQKSNRVHKQHTIILIDEAHLFIDPHLPIATQFMYSMAKRIRKYGGALIPATQNISDWTGSEELFQQTSAIIKNSQYTFVFKLSDNDVIDLADLYTASGGLNYEECRRIRVAPTGETFFIGGDQRFSVAIQTPVAISDLFADETEKERLGTHVVV